MPLRVQIVSVAEIEITEAIDYYESCSSGLGSDFLCELEEALDRIARHPMAWQPIDPKNTQMPPEKVPLCITLLPYNT